MRQLQSPRLLLLAVLLMGVSLALIRTVVDFMPPAVMLPPGKWAIGYTLFGAVYGALLRVVILGRFSLRQMLLLGALAFGSTFQVLVFTWSWLFEDYGVWSLGWPWSGLLLFAALGGIGSGVLAHYGRLAIRPIVLGAGAFVAFASGELADLAVRHWVVPLVQIPVLTTPIAMLVHLAANFSCGAIIGVGVWWLLTTWLAPRHPTLHIE